MKHKIAFLIVVIAVLIAVVLNVVLFTVVPEAIIAHPAFWVTWVFTFPVNLALLILATLSVTGKKKNATLHVPPMLYVVYLFCGLYFSIGFKLIRLPFTSAKLPLVIEIVLTAAYVIALLVVSAVTGAMEKQEAYEQKKVDYLASLRTEIESVLPFATERELRAALTRLIDALRFSDPMSHESLAPTEKEIAKICRRIVRALKTEENADILADIQKAEGLVAYRNERCKQLK